MFTFRNIAEATGAMFPNVNIAMRLERIPHNKNVPPHPNKTCRPNRGGTPSFYSANSLKYGDEGARPGGVI